MRDAANTSSLEAAAEQRKSGHSQCRASEQALLVEQQGKYQQLNATWSGLSKPSCSASMVVTDPWDARVDCFGAIQDWLQTGADAVQGALNDWVLSLGLEHNQTALCHGMQHAFERSFCSWTEAQNLTCAAYHACFQDRSEQHAQLSVAADAVERSSKADYTAAAHVLCRIAVLNASSAQKEETLEACLGQIVDTNHLNVSYPELVTEDLCLVPEDFPCQAAWLDRNYAGESWYGVVQLRDCSPCTTTTTTIALPSISVGRLHSIILDGQTAWHLGSNVDGEKGDGTTSTSDGHVPFNVMGDVRSVSCGARATLFVKVDGTAWGVGSNHYGQLGTGTTEDATTPVEIMGSVRKATMGIYNSVFVKEDGTAWTAGFNDQGQIGDGSKMYRGPDTCTGNDGCCGHSQRF